MHFIILRFSRLSDIALYTLNFIGRLRKCSLFLKLHTNKVYIYICTFYVWVTISTMRLQCDCNNSKFNHHISYKACKSQTAEIIQSYAMKAAAVIKLFWSH